MFILMCYDFSLSQDGLRGLDHACFLGHEETAKLLVSRGASVKTVSGVWHSYYVFAS